MSELRFYLEKAVESGASDLFIVTGSPVSIKLDGGIEAVENANAEGERKEWLMPQDTEHLIREAYALAGRGMERLLEIGDDDFSLSVSGLARFRVNAYRQRGSLAAVIRVVSFVIPDYKIMRIPEGVMNLAELTHGMIIITGTAGSGKSTTQACIIDRINKTRKAHIITLEDPIEFLHHNTKSIVSQREIAIDTQDFLSALRSCLRQTPDVIQLGELRDADTMRVAMTAAETGHLLITTLHTKGAVNTIDRIIDTFPADQQAQIRLQLSSVLRTVVSQQLLPKRDGDLVPAFEIMHTTNAVRTMIRDNKIYQLNNVISAGGREGMISMDQSILNLYKEGVITEETALIYCDNTEQLKRLM